MRMRTCKIVIGRCTRVNQKVISTSERLKPSRLDTVNRHASLCKVTSTSNTDRPARYRCELHRHLFMLRFISLSLAEYHLTLLQIMFHQAHRLDSRHDLGPALPAKRGEVPLRISKQRKQRTRLQQEGGLNFLDDHTRLVEKQENPVCDDVRLRSPRFKVQAEILIGDSRYTQQFTH
nr:hypothetical protein CFP56_33700 [Quercus suber]